MTNSQQGGTHLSSVGTGVVMYGGGKIAEICFGLLFTILLTNSLGESKYGVFVLAFTIITLVSEIATLGSEKAILRFLPSNRDCQNEYWSFSVLISIFGALFVASILFLLAPKLTEHTVRGTEFSYALKMFSLALIAIVGIRIVRNSFRAIDKPGFSTLYYQIIRPAVKFIVVGLAIFVSPSLTTVVNSTILSLISILSLGLLMIRNYTILGFKPTIDMPVKSYFSFSIPTSIKNVGSLLYSRVDILMLGYFATSSDIGVYNVSIALATMVVLPLDGVNEIFPSIVSGLWENGKKSSIQELFSTVTRWAISISLPAALGLLFLTKEVLGIMGPGFTSGTTVLSVLILGQFINTVVGPSGYLLLMTDRQWVETTNQWIFGILNVILNFALITWVGVLGAAIATFTTLTLLNLTRLLEIFYFEGWIPFEAELAKPIFSSLVMCLLLTLVSPLASTLLGLLFVILLSAASYFTTLYLCGISDSDRDTYNEVRNNISL